MGNLQIGGIASGMDTESLVKQLMSLKRAPVDKLHQKKQTLEWKRDDYREMNSLLTELRQTIQDGIGKQASFLAKKITSSNESYVTATSSGVVNGNVNNTLEVVNLATAATWQSNGAINTAGLTDQTLKFNVTKPGETTATPVEISIKSTDTADSIIKKFNESGLGITAMHENIYNSGTGLYETKVVFSNNLTGANGSITTLDAGTTTFMTNVMQMNVTGSTLDQKTAGTDAVIKLNGFQMQKSSNTFSVNGVQYNLKRAAATAGETVNITATADTDKIYDTVIKFMDKYNEVIDKINKKVKEERYRTFTPLTTEQKDAMSDTEIEKWEEKAKSGMLKGDSILTQALSKMRINLSSEVSGLPADAQSYLSDIGIVTSNLYNLSPGKLELNKTSTGNPKMTGEERLRAAIEKDPMGIYNLFYADGTTTGEKGLGRRLAETIQSVEKEIATVAGRSGSVSTTFNIGKSILQIDGDIKRNESRLAVIEKRYWSQFTAMEKAIQNSNSQGSYLMQMFSQSSN